MKLGTALMGKGEKKMRLIDADALKKELAKRTPHFAQRIELTPCFEAIRDAPTVDAVPVVRCKDCNHCKPWYRDRGLCLIWGETGASVFLDGFCSYGERKTE